jgi:hypothetical protein
MTENRRIPEGRARWIVGRAQSAINGSSDEFYSVRLDELEQADEWCGHHDVHASYRLLMKNRIETLKRERDSRERRNENRKSALIGFVLSLVVALLAVAVDRYFSIL